MSHQFHSVFFFNLVVSILVSFGCFLVLPYECFNTVESNKLDVEKLSFWCQYWILVAALQFLSE
ncbi:hypothetical protein ZOSMA_89G01240 [Zostera marina]|uniref:HVA22-like protein n=1 Tax=Zostera marina TaxID=29655 RepID=A0A0K9NK89_ZOSMR|nr:hypothetical protein ZOSMA_89G01240 [Zostera marina]